MKYHADYSKQAELALAAYANFLTEIPNQDELREAGVPIRASQALLRLQHRVFLP